MYVLSILTNTKSAALGDPLGISIKFQVCINHYETTSSILEV